MKALFQTTCFYFHLNLFTDHNTATCIFQSVYRIFSCTVPLNGEGVSLSLIMSFSKEALFPKRKSHSVGGAKDCLCTSELENKPVDLPGSPCLVFSFYPSSIYLFVVSFINSIFFFFTLANLSTSSQLLLRFEIYIYSFSE